jgi:hypothetical protein
MKKLLLFLFIFGLLYSPLHAGGVVMLAGGAGADVTAPTVSTATIGTNGTTLTLAMSETVTRSGGTFDVDCATAGANITATYASGSGSNSLVYTLGTTVNSGDTCNLDYNGAANGIEDAAGNDLSAITDKAVTNNSTQGVAGIAYVRSAVSGTGTDGDATTTTAAFSANTLGSLLVCGYTTGADPDAESGSIADSNTNTWHAVEASTYDTSNGQGIKAWYVYNAKASAGSNTVTVTTDNARGFRRLVCDEFSGVLTTDPLDKKVGNKATATTATDNATTTAQTPTSNGQLIWGYVMDDGAGGTITHGTGLSEGGKTSDAYRMASGYKVQATAASTAVTWTFGTAGAYIAEMATFSPAP